MDPTAVSQKQLLTWAREMGYSQTIPNQFISACNTPERRLLWDAITKTLKDRRKIIKESSGNSKEKCLIEAIDGFRKEIASSDAEIDRYEKKITMRFSKLENMEKATHELELKRVLFRRIRARNLEKVAKYHEINKSIDDNCKASPDPSREDLERWNSLIAVELRTRLEDPGVVDIAAALIKKNNLECDALFQLLLKEQQQLLLTVTSYSNSLSQDFQRNNTSPVNDDWNVLLSTQKMDTAMVNALTALLRGYKMRQSTDTGDIDTLVDNISTNIMTEIENLPLVEDNELEKLKTQSTALKLKNENVKKYVNDLYQRYKTALDNSSSKQSILTNLVADLCTTVRIDASKWRLVLERHTHVINKHTEYLWHCRLPNSSERLLSPKQNIDIPPTMYDTTISSNEKNLQEISSLITALLSDTDDVTLESRRGKKIGRQLRNAFERLNNLTGEIGQIEHILKLWKEQPFGELIPTSHTVNGMTFKEWMFQMSLSNSIPRRVDFSLSVYPADL